MWRLPTSEFFLLPRFTLGHNNINVGPEILDVILKNCLRFISMLTLL
jgi:hypothetical protein